MKRIVLILLGGALVLGACQSASEVLTEQIAEQAEGVNNVEVNTETGEFKIETDEGTISVGSGEIPDGFPIAVPDGGDVISNVTVGSQVGLTLLYPMDRYDGLVVFYDDWTAQQPGEWNTFSGANSAGEQTFRNASWFQEDPAGTGTSFMIGVSDCVGPSVSSVDTDTVCVTLSVIDSTG
ncbi:MAG: hypothetical protein ACC654_09385 [Acidimicrobiia bacterium]